MVAGVLQGHLQLTGAGVLEAVVDRLLHNAEHRHFQLGFQAALPPQQDKAGLDPALFGEVVQVVVDGEHQTQIIQGHGVEIVDDPPQIRHGPLGDLFQTLEFLPGFRLPPRFVEPLADLQLHHQVGQILHRSVMEGPGHALAFDLLAQEHLLAGLLPHVHVLQLLVHIQEAAGKVGHGHAHLGNKPLCFGGDLPQFGQGLLQIIAADPQQPLPFPGRGQGGANLLRLFVDALLLRFAVLLVVPVGPEQLHTDHRKAPGQLFHFDDGLLHFGLHGLQHNFRAGALLLSRFRHLEDLGAPFLQSLPRPL